MVGVEKTLWFHFECIKGLLEYFLLILWWSLFALKLHVYLEQLFLLPFANGCLKILFSSTELSASKSKSQLPKKFFFICFKESSLKVMKNTFHLMLKALFVRKISKGYLRYKTITSQNVPSKTQIKNFFIS